MKPKKKRFGQASLLLAALLAMAALSACGSKDTAAPTAENTQAAEAQTEATQTETETTTAALSEDADAEIDTASTGKGPIKESDMENPEPVQYEGIDLTSTLPAYEWIKTFPHENGGYCNAFGAPKLIIYNDRTNYKVIAEDGQRIKFHRGDCLMVYDQVELKKEACKPISLKEINDNDYDRISSTEIISDTGFFFYNSSFSKYDANIENADYWNHLFDNAVYDEETGGYVLEMPDSYNIEDTASAEPEEVDDWFAWYTPISYWGIDNDMWRIGEMNVFVAAKHSNKSEWNEERVIYNPDSRWECDVTLVFVE